MTLEALPRENDRKQVLQLKRELRTAPIGTRLSVNHEGNVKIAELRSPYVNSDMVAVAFWKLRKNGEFKRPKGDTLEQVWIPIESVKKRLA